MFKIMKAFLQRKTRGYSDDDVDFMNQLIRGNKPFDILDNTSNLIGHFLNVESERNTIAKAIVHASERTTTEIGFKGAFLDLFDLKAIATMREAAIAAEGFADRLYTDKDATLAMMSDAYSFIAVLCYGRLGKYRGSEDQKIFEMAAQLFGAITAAQK